MEHAPQAKHLFSHIKNCHNMYLLSIHWIDCIKHGDKKKKLKSVQK
jgi:hypothetical protein